MRSQMLTKLAVAAALAAVCVGGVVGLTHFASFVSSAGAPASTAPATVAARGVTLTSVSFDMPDQAASYPAGPHMDVMNANCLTCHSPSMVTNQPHLSADEWAAEVKKMRETYKAKVDEASVPDIVAYLSHLSDEMVPGTPSGVAKNPIGRPAADGGATG